MKSVLIARKGILSGSTAIQKMNASALEPSSLWFRKRGWGVCGGRS